jgi:hypothetical protein
VIPDWREWREDILSYSAPEAQEYSGVGSRTSRANANTLRWCHPKHPYRSRPGGADGLSENLSAIEVEGVKPLPVELDDPADGPPPRRHVSESDAMIVRELMETYVVLLPRYAPDLVTGAYTSRYRRPTRMDPLRTCDAAM